MAPEMQEKTSFSVQQQQQQQQQQQLGKSFGDPSTYERSHSMFIIAQMSLRMLAILFTLTAISIILTDKQSVTVFGFQFKARYFYSSAYRFLVGADGVVCSFSVVSLAFLLYHLRVSETTDSQAQLRKYFFLFLHDTVILVLAVAGCAAASAIGYVGRHGEDHMLWQKVCNQVSNFCNKMMIATLFSYLASFAYFALTLISAHRLMYRFPSSK